MISSPLTERRKHKRGVERERNFVPSFLPSAVETRRKFLGWFQCGFELCFKNDGKVKEGWKVCLACFDCTFNGTSYICIYYILVFHGGNFCKFVWICVQWFILVIFIFILLVELWMCLLWWVSHFWPHNWLGEVIDCCSSIVWSPSLFCMMTIHSLRSLCFLYGS